MANEHWIWQVNATRDGVETFIAKHIFILQFPSQLAILLSMRVNKK